MVARNPAVHAGFRPVKLAACSPVKTAQIRLTRGATSAKLAQRMRAWVWGSAHLMPGNEEQAAGLLDAYLEAAISDRGR
jgi:hypothetical protein